MSVNFFKYKTVWLFLMPLFTDCGHSKRDIRQFYFPLKSLQEPLVYEYRSTQQDRLPSFYCYMQTMIQHDSVFFMTNTYGADFETLQFDRELQTPQGMLLKSLFQYLPDTAGKRSQNQVEILSGNAFPYQVRDSNGIFVYNISWKNNMDSTQYSIIRNRRFGGDTTWTFQGKTYPAIWFHLRELRDRYNKGHTSVEFIGKEVFAENLGLVSIRRTFSGRVIEYQLMDKYDMKTLEEKFRKIPK